MLLYRINVHKYKYRKWIRNRSRCYLRGAALRGPRAFTQYRPQRRLNADWCLSFLQIQIRLALKIASNTHSLRAYTKRCLRRGVTKLEGDWGLKTITTILTIQKSFCCHWFLYIPDNVFLLFEHVHSAPVSIIWIFECRLYVIIGSLAIETRLFLFY